MANRASVLAQLARAMVSHADVGPLPLRWCHACVDILGATGGAITLAYTRPERVTLCVTDQTAARLEDLQDVVGQGPGPDAFAEERIVTAVLDSAESRWPMFTEAARVALGDLAMTAVPIRPDGRVLGVLTVHLPASGLIEQSVAQFLADALGAALLRDPDSQTELRPGPWSGRARVHQATGMVVAQLKINPEDALVLLRAHAYAHDVSLDEVARQVVDLALDFAITDDGTGDQS